MERRACVQQNRVPSGALFAVENAACCFGVFSGGAACKLGFVVPLHAELLGGYLILLEIAVRELHHLSGSADGYLVELIGSVDRHTALYAELGQRLCHGHEQLRLVNSEELHICVSRVCERPEDIEHGRNSYFLADGAYVLHCAVVLLREQEAHSHLVEELHAASRVGGDIHPEGLEAVGGAALAGGCAVAVLSDLSASRCAYQSGDSGNVDGVGAVAAGAYNFEHVAGVVHTVCAVAHYICGSGYLVGGLALDVERGQIRRGLRLSRASGHYLAGYFRGLVVGKVNALGSLLYHFLYHNVTSRKFSAIFLPSFVSIDSGWN